MNIQHLRRTEGSSDIWIFELEDAKNQTKIETRKLKLKLELKKSKQN